MMSRKLAPWSSWRDLDRFFEEGMLEEGVDFTPLMDVYQKEDDVIVETPLTGIDPDKVNISIENDVLTVSGKAEEKKEVKKEDYYRREIRKGSFSRSVILPMNVKGSQAKASYEKGILKIVLPKAEEAKPKRIAIKVKK